MLARPEIAKRICSPTATAMAVGGADASTVARRDNGLLDPNTKAYGKWPLAIYWASQQQRLGAVEAVFDWARLKRCCAAVHPSFAVSALPRGLCPVLP